MRKSLLLGLVMIITMLGIASAEEYVYNAKDCEIYNEQVEDSLYKYNSMYEKGKEDSLDDSNSFVMKTASPEEAFFYKNIDEYLVLGHKEGKELSQMAASENYILFPSYNNEGYAMSIVYRYDELKRKYLLDTTSVSADPSATCTLSASDISKYANSIGEKVREVEIYYSTLYNMYLVDISSENNNYIVPVYYLSDEVNVKDWFPFKSGSILTADDFYKTMDEYYDEEYTRDYVRNSTERLYGAGIYHRSDVESLGLDKQLKKSSLDSTYNSSKEESKSAIKNKITIYITIILVICGIEGLHLYIKYNNK